MGRRLTGVALALALGVGAASGAAAQGVDWTLTGGEAKKADVKKLGVIAGWTRAEPLWQGQQWRLKLRHEVELSAWDVPKASDLVEFGYSPILRLIRPLGQHERLFTEGSVGVRLLSNTRMSSDTNLSTAFQFSDMLGVGYQWGPKQRHTVGTRYVHLSNAGIKKPNDGMNFGLMYYQYKFR